MDKPIPYCNPEIWGGIECTINRVGDEFFDQLRYSGHYSRENDIEKIAALGIRKLRYPILWEKHQLEKGGAIDWSWTQGQLDALRKHGIDIIAGLVHHGSGPAFTQLDDPQFPYLLADYARQVAEQFPWISDYTPVNEPLTTARFSGLYGLWYPHRRNARSFMKMLLTELKAVVLSMQAIRKVNPSARLVQTEDLGKTYATPILQYQAKFENERRWLTYDILCGKFNEQHRLWKYFQQFAIPKEDYQFFIDNPCVPDIFGFNHYLTSERFLDDKLENYPVHTHGGNARHRYADVEAVRVEVNEPTGIEVLLKEAWERYGKPIAVTEVHLHSHREEQLRWFRQVWESACRLRAQGVDVRAITSWALLGSYGWNKLLTQPKGTYEPGAFDLRSGELRPTAVAHFIRQTIKAGDGEHHLSKDKGWWQRNSRLIYAGTPPPVYIRSHQPAPLLIIGKNGTLGKSFAKACEERCLHYRLLAREDCDISDLASIEAALERYEPWAVINAAGYVRVDDAETDSAACLRDNTTGAHNLAIACEAKQVPLLSFSSDLVFDGTKPTAYVESDAVHPLNVYGRSKAEAEVLMQEAMPSVLIARTSAFFGPWDPYNFVHAVSKSLSGYEPVTVADDLVMAPTYVPHLTHAALDLMIDGESGIWHLANAGALTWAELAYTVARRFDLDDNLIRPVSAAQLQYPALRPANSALTSERGVLLPDLSTAIEEYAQHRRIESLGLV